MGKNGARIAQERIDIERREQLDFLRAEHCDEVQGYLISRPVEAETLAGLLHAQIAD